ncbi:hypothetical protein NC00_02650 [Xanthomonas cannabis pv. phaseoli]|uniref:Uncharacterized protein n=1 Tax=Xanthomonas cannabis pv. phaseoli TaxID=1885902 RepID=A0AB34PC94_9XANT|nr:hypothetical protein [Xanthomonas cannabis]KGK59250.1 hypothetical protein NC00_02650 [Xanthomonas cannabis pv. phaseoli]
MSTQQPSAAAKALCVHTSGNGAHPTAPGNGVLLRRAEEQARSADTGHARMAHGVTCTQATP